MGALASTAMAWIQGGKGGGKTEVAPFFGTANLKSKSSGGKGGQKQNGGAGLDMLAVIDDGLRQKLQTILERQRPQMRAFQAKQGELMAMLDGLRNGESVSLSKLMPIARELGKLEANIAVLQAEQLAPLRLGIEGPILQRMQNVRSAYVNNYSPSVTEEERDAAQRFVASLPRDDQRAITSLSGKALAWLTIARPPVDTGGGKGGKPGGGKGSKSAGYLSIKAGGKEAAGNQILSQLTTSQVRILTSAAVSQAAYRNAYEERRRWLELSLAGLKQARPIDITTIERVASDLGGYSGRIAYSRAKAFQSLSKTLTDEQRKNLLPGRQVARRN